MMNTASRDYMKYDVEIRDETFGPLNKRRTMFTILKHLCEVEGVAPESIEEACIPSVRDRSMFRVIDGTEDLDEKRWFAERISCRGKSYAVSNQWGIKTTQPVIDRLKEQFPDAHKRIRVSARRQKP